MSNSQTQQGLVLKHLREYFSLDHPPLFQDVKQLPVFFESNLLDESRVVKYLHDDPQANLRVFYYQYLKLCFEIDNIDYESYIEKIYELIRTENFEFTFDCEESQKPYKNAQYKSLMVDFFEIMNLGSLTIDMALNQYPVMDEVFINFFRTVVILANVASSYNSYIDKTDLFDFLSSFFAVDISAYDKCLKFVESDIFVYEENPHNIYMAFIEENSQQQQQEGQSSQKVPFLHSEGQQEQQKGAMSEEISAFNSNEELEQPQIQIGIHNERVISNKSNSYAPASTPTEHHDSTLKVNIRTVIKESFIESEFTDYTQALSSNAVDTRKSTEDVQRNDELVKTQLETVFARKSPIKTLLEYDMPEEEVKNNQMKRSGSEKIELVVDGKNGTAANLLNKDQSEPSLVYASRNYQEPTKDPGFEVQRQQEANTKKLQPYKRFTKAEAKEMTVYESVEISSLKEQPQITLNKQQIQPSNGDHKGANTRKNQILTQETEKKSKLQEYASAKMAQTLSYDSWSSHKQEKASEKFEPKPSYKVIDVQSEVKKTTLNGGKLKLNVTQQFSNSLVMQCLKEPHNSNVRSIRERARRYRKNIYSELAVQSNTELETGRNPSVNLQKRQTPYQTHGNNSDLASRHNRPPSQQNIGNYIGSSNLKGQISVKGGFQQSNYHSVGYQPKGHFEQKIIDRNQSSSYQYQSQR